MDRSSRFFHASSRSSPTTVGEMSMVTMIQPRGTPVLTVTFELHQCDNIIQHGSPVLWGPILQLHIMWQIEVTSIWSNCKYTDYLSLVVHCPLSTCLLGVRVTHIKCSLSLPPQISVSELESDLQDDGARQPKTPLAQSSKNRKYSAKLYN